MFGHVEVPDFTAIMRKHDQDEKNTERGRWDGEEIDRNEIADVVVEESPPVLRWRLPSLWHPAGDGPFGNVDSELQQFVMHPGRFCVKGFVPAWSKRGGTASAWAGRSQRHSTPTRSGSFTAPALAKLRSPADCRSAVHPCDAF